MVILRIVIARRAQGGDGAVAVAEPVADGAEREPGRCEGRRKFHRLRQDVGRARKIALRGVIERPLVAPVGDQIAGGDEQRAGLHLSRLPE